MSVNVTTCFSLTAVSQLMWVTFQWDLEVICWRRGESQEVSARTGLIPAQRITHVLSSAPSQQDLPCEGGHG